MKSLSLPRRLLFLALALCLLLAAGCAKKQETPADVPVVGDLKYESTVPLEYADQFAIYCYEGGYRFIDMKNSDRMLVVPEGKEVPAGLDRDVVVVQQPLKDVYMVATSPMALVDAIDGLDQISFVGSKNWYSDGASQNSHSAEHQK